MSQVVGKVEVVTPDKRGNFRLKVGEKWYGTGVNKLPGDLQKGDTVEFLFEANGPFNNIDMKSLKIVAQKEVAAKPTYAPQIVYGEKTDAKPVDWDLKDKKIQWQAARNSAIEYIKVLLDVNVQAVKLPAAQKDKVPAIDKLLAHYTNVFFNETQTLGVESKGSTEAADDLSGEE